MPWSWTQPALRRLGLGAKRKETTRLVPCLRSLLWHETHDTPQLSEGAEAEEHGSPAQGR